VRAYRGHRTTARRPSLSLEASQPSLFKAALLHRTSILASTLVLHCAPPLEAAAKNQGSDRLLSPTKAPSTSPCTYYSSPTRSRFPRSRHLAGAGRTATGNGRRRRTTPPAPPPPQPWVEIEPREPLDHPTPVPGRPRRRSSPELRRPRRPPPRGPYCETSVFSEGRSAN
jgi:hypothetical protein